MANLPAVDASSRKVFHEGFFFRGRDAHEKASACFGCVALEEFEVDDFILDFGETFIDWQGVNNKLHIDALSLSEIVSMSEDAKSCNISTGSNLILPNQFGSYETQSPHLFFGSIIRLHKF